MFKHTFDVTWLCMVSHVFDVTWLCVVDHAFDDTQHLGVCKEGCRKSLACPYILPWEEAAAPAETTSLTFQLFPFKVVSCFVNFKTQFLRKGL